MVNFWGPENSNILDAHVTEVEDVFEDSLSELPEETSPHVEEEKKSVDEEEEKEETATSEETANFAKEAAPQEEKKVYGLFDSTSNYTSKNQALVNVKKTRMPVNLSTTIPMARRSQLVPPRRVASGGPVTVMKRSSKVPANLSTTFPISASSRRRRKLLPLASLNNVLGSSESPSALTQSSPMKVFSFSEVHRTRHQEKKSGDKTEEVKGVATNALGSSESPAALEKRSPFKVVSFADAELHRTTRHQEKVVMEEVKEGRKKVMQFSFLNSNILIYELNVTISV